MEKRYTLALSLLLFVSAQAQITITQAEMPAANDELVRVKAVTDAFVNYAATGPAFTWNFPNLAADAGDTTNYQTVASTNFVYAIVYADIFFNPNRANHAKPGTDIAFSQLLPLDNPYTFRYGSSTSYKTVGFGAEVSGIPLPILFDEHDVIYELPLEYGNTSASHSTYHIDIPNLGYYGFEQDRTNEVDGWGQITTPGGVFDVIRVKTTLAVHDSLFGFGFDRPIAHEYKWLTAGLRVPVLQINTTALFGTEVVNAIYYYDVPRTIEVVAPLASTICPGSQIPVNYAVTGAFNAGGFFVPANQFIAQLSDATGSFGAPVNIGSVTATGAGVINATIPGNTSAGPGYRIRVISTSPDHIGTSDTFDINIGGPSVAAITAGGPALICTGGSVTLTAVGGPSYQWQRDGSDIDGETGNTYAASEAGSYTVLVDNTCGTATSNAIAVEINAPPTHTVDETAYTICSGASISFTAHDQSEQDDLGYQWFLNDAPIADATDSTVVAALAGIYTAVVTNGTTGCTFTTEEVVVTLDAVPAAEVSADGSTTFCAGGSVTLSVPVTSDVTYQWYVDDMLIDAATDPELTASATGDYTVVLTNANNCASEASASITVTADAPVAPGVTTTEPTTFCEGNGATLIADFIADVDYQWLLDGSSIDGATAGQLTVTAAGAYTVMITTANDCSATSDPALEVVVNPLPATPVITAPDGTLLASGSGSFQWYLDGEAITDATEATWVPLENGSYTVELTDGNGCSSVSDAYIVLSTGVNTLSRNVVQVVPNPSNGSFTIQVPAAQGRTYEILDATGKRVHTGRLNALLTVVDMSTAEQGMYFLRVSGSAVPVQRIAITR